MATIVKGDEKSAAASVIAKVTPDAKITRMALIYQGYGFEINMGYPTKKHKEALQSNGATKYHRKNSLAKF